MLGTYALSSGYYDAYYKKAQQVRGLIKRDFAACFEKYDVLLTPTTPTTAYKFGEKSDPVAMYMGDICTVAVNIAGLPAISIPAGLDKKGMPIGIQLIANSLDERKLLTAAFAYERETGYEKLRPTVKEVAQPTLNTGTQSKYKSALFFSSVSMYLLIQFHFSLFSLL